MFINPHTRGFSYTTILDLPYMAECVALLAVMIAFPGAIALNTPLESIVPTNSLSTSHITS